MSIFRHFVRTVTLCTSVVVAIAFVGCGSETDESTAQALLRSKRILENLKESTPGSVSERYDAAMERFDRQDFFGAQRELRPLLTAEAADANAILLYARCEAANGDSAAACEMLLSITPSDQIAFVDAALLAADWFIETGEYDFATDRLQRVIDLNVTDETPKMSRVYHRIAATLNNLGRRIEAAKYLRLLARSGEVTEKELFAMNTYSDAFIDASMPQPVFSGALTPSALVEAKRLRADGDLGKARSTIEQLSQAFPESPQIAAFQYRIYAELKLYDLLDSLLDELPPEIESEPEYWHAVGVWMQSLNRDREAVRCFVEAVTRDETDRFSYLALARSLTALGKASEAKLANQRFSLLYEAAKIAMKIGREPGSLSELSRMAEILDVLGRPSEALAWREISMKRYGGSPALQKKLTEQRSADRAIEHSMDHLEFITCSINADDWPIPVKAESALASRPDSTADLLGESTVVEIKLNDVAAEVGLDFTYDNGDDPSDDRQALHQLTGGGIGVIDFDLDGNPDLYFTQGGGDAFDANGSKPNPLFRNLDATEWNSVSLSAGTGDRGYGQGVAVADINQDGFPDMMLANIGPNIVYQNNGDGTFTRHRLGTDDDHGDWTTSIACGDLSGDHLPEIVEINYIDDAAALTVACTPDRDVCNPSVFHSAIDQVWQVKADGGVGRWLGCVGMDAKPNYGFAAVIADFDDRNGNDLFIANDTESNHFWVSQQGSDLSDRTLAESAQVAGCAFGLLGQRQGCMGIAAGDFDRNGLIDLHVTNFWNQAADLYSQDVSGVFTNNNTKFGLYRETRLTVGWGTQAVDFDRNGWLDLAVLNGNLADHRHRGRDYQMRPQFFRADADGFHMQAPDHAYWSTPALGRVMAVLDFNSDLKPDLVTNHLDLPAALLENQTSAHDCLQLELVGTLSERDAIGAKVTIEVAGQRWVNWVTGGDGLLCSNESVLDFGVGRHDQIDRIDVTWPSGISQQFTNIQTNHRYLMIEGDLTLIQR